MTVAQSGHGQWRRLTPTVYGNEIKHWFDFDDLMNLRDTSEIAQAGKCPETTTVYEGRMGE